MWSGILHCDRVKAGNSIVFPRPIRARDWEQIVETIGRRGSYERLYVAALMCAKECRYRAEDFGGEEWYYWTTEELTRYQRGAVR